MILALCDMSLIMWKNICNSLHGRTQEEKLQKRRNKLQKEIEWCFCNQRLIPVKHHKILQLDVKTLCTKRSPNYLKQWLGTYKAYRDQGERDYFGDNLVAESKDDESEGTSDTPGLDIDKYLWEITDGMDREGTLAETGQMNNRIEPKPPWRGT